MTTRTAVAYGRFSPRRGGWRANSWWARAFLRAIEEMAYDEAQLAAGRALARSGQVGGLIVDAGSVVASVEDPHVTASTGETGLYSVRIDVPVLDDDARAALGEVSLDPVFDGDLPHDLVEHLEELGVELLPYGSELTAVCTCRSWHEVCVHALGVLQQVAWLLDGSPAVLLHLRGAPHTAAGRHPEGDSSPREAYDVPEVDPIEVALDAAVRARAILGDG